MNVSQIHDCFGCGVCAIACGRKIIDIQLNADGFYEPYITEHEKCTDCGLCVEVCSYSHHDIALKDSSISSYAAWSKDAAVRRKCSSGGIGFELGRRLIADGYKVSGVRYNAEKNQAEHYIATTVEELIASIGSKYIQSYTVDGFRQINRKEKYLVTGTPCQIDSFRRYIQRFKCEDNFVLMDFFCHGVPSKLMWDKYVKWAEKKVGKLTYVSWRNKQTGWHDSWAMAIDGEEHGEKVNWHDSYNMLIKGGKSYLNSRLSQGDMFYKLFLSNACLGNACYEKCRFKWDHSSADIRIGDAWGTAFKNNEEGISAAVAFTQKGKTLLQSCNCQLEEHPFNVVSENQMHTCATKTRLYSWVMKLLHDNSKTIVDVCGLVRKYKKQEKWEKRLKDSFGTICRFLNKVRTK